MPSSHSAVSPASKIARSFGLLLTFVVACVGGGILVAGVAMPVALGTAGAVDTGITMFNDIEVDLNQVLVEPSAKSTILDAAGNKLADIYAQDRIVVGHDQISNNMRLAVVAIEDKRFYEHGAIDPYGMARAFVSNASEGSSQGASTLTQQVVKNALLEDATQRGDKKGQFDAVKPDYSRKIREMKLAIDLESTKSKDEILDDYLNLAQFGKSVYGVEAASQHFFGKSAADLTIGEAALLAGTTKNPAKYDAGAVVNDDLDPATRELRTEDVTNRRNTVLKVMLDERKITQEEYDFAVAQPVAEMLVNMQDAKNGCKQADAVNGSGYFCEYVTKLIKNAPGFFDTDVPEERMQMLLRGGLTIHTTLDPNDQAAAYQAVIDTVPIADPTATKTGVNAAISSINVDTGGIVAMAQNTRYTTIDEGRGSTNINVNVPSIYGGGAGMQTGSTSKAITLGTWIEDGHSLNEVVNGDSRRWTSKDFTASCSKPQSDDKVVQNWGWGADIRPWTPKNAESGSGPMTAEQATYRSVNTSYIDMTSKLDLCDIRDNAVEMGFVRADGRPMQVTPTMTLGTNESSPLVMAEVFSTFARDGEHCTTIAVTSITDADGNPQTVPTSTCNQVFTPEVNAAAVKAMSEVPTIGTAKGKINLDVPVAGKTGTANDDMQSWFVGYTKHVVTAAWVGTGVESLDGTNPKPTPMINIRINGRTHGNVYGAVLAAPMWNKYMQVATDGDPADGFRQPGDKEVWGEKIAIPNTVGLSVEEAQQSLTTAGFGNIKIAETPIDSPYAEGLVAQQDPSGGQAFKGQEITLTLSSGVAPVVQPTQQPTSGPTSFPTGVPTMIPVPPTPTPTPTR